MAASSDATASVPPLQDLPTAKERRYDRQLRLWGSSGQVALENTHILLINNGSGVAGIEALKNLVLPGVGRFTVQDSAVVDERDLGVNFFLTEESLGRFRADETVRLLGKLNPDVWGRAVREPLETFITESLTVKYTFILVAGPIHPTSLSHLLQHATLHNIPIFYMQCIGFYSRLSIALPPAFPIVDTHPDPTATTDLRLLSPWDELETFARSKTDGLQTMSAHEKSHVPYLCILLHFLSIWKQDHGGKAPATYKEKQEFRNNYVGRESPEEENFQEAYGAVLKSLNPPTANSAVREILAAPEAQNCTAETPAFWLIANAVQRFYANHGELPLPGAVPDMKAQSADYVRLQEIYKAKARSDAAEVERSVREVEQASGRTAKHGEIDQKEIENFCKLAAHIHLVRGRPFHIVTAGKWPSFGDRAKALFNDLTNPDSLICVYLAFLAYEKFSATHQSSASVQGGEAVRQGGSSGADFASDEAKMAGIARAVVDHLIEEAESRLEEPEYSTAVDGVVKVCGELVRAGGAELHNIASLMGGVVAQEVIKVVTKQYVPVDNTCLFDGVGSRSGVLRV